MRLAWGWRGSRDASVVGLLLLVCFLAVYATGGSHTALPHAFYIPIVVAAVRFGWTGAAVTAVVAGLACGPLMPLNVATGTPQPTGNWLLRAVFFVVVAGVATAARNHERRTIEQERTLAAERMDLVTARGTLLQIVSHELRTPLTIIKGSAHLLGTPEDGGRSRAALVLAVQRAIRRLEDLAQVVNAAVERPGQPFGTVAVSVATILDDAIAGIAPEQRPDRVAVEVAADAALETQPELLRSAVRWLTENALKFSPPDEPVQVSARTNGATIVIEIRDHGPGIPEAFTDEPFSALRQGDASTTREQGGLGLGLYATERLVERLGGGITVERGADGGTIATLKLPIRPCGHDLTSPPLLGQSLPD